MSNESQTHKRNKKMKKTMTIGMMTIMMVLGTTTSFGKTNGRPSNEMNQPRQEVRVSRSSFTGLQGKNHSGDMHPEMEKPIPPHRHEFGGPRHECRICHMTEHQVHKMEMNMQHSPVKTMPQHSSPRH